jgi:hypothetical protein
LVSSGGLSGQCGKTRAKTSSYQVIKQIGDYDDSKQAAQEEQARPLDANRGDVLEWGLHLSACDDRRSGHCRVRYQ